MNKSVSRLRTFLSKRVRKRYTVAASVVARHAKIDKFFAVSNDPRAVLKYVGSKVGLINFQARSRIIRGTDKRGRRYKRQGVSVRVLRDEPRKVVKNVPGFIATGVNSNRHIFARTADSRFPLVSLKGPSVAEMVGRKEVQEGVNDFLGDTMPRLFDHELDHFLLKQVGLRK